MRQLRVDVPLKLLLCRSAGSASSLALLGSALLWQRAAFTPRRRADDTALELSYVKAAAPPRLSCVLPRAPLSRKKPHSILEIYVALLGGTPGAGPGLEGGGGKREAGDLIGCFYRRLCRALVPHRQWPTNERRSSPIWGRNQTKVEMPLLTLLL